MVDYCYSIVKRIVSANIYGKDIHLLYTSCYHKKYDQEIDQCYVHTTKYQSYFSAPTKITNNTCHKKYLTKVEQKGRISYKKIKTTLRKGS